MKENHHKFSIVIEQYTEKYTRSERDSNPLFRCFNDIRPL